MVITSSVVRTAAIVLVAACVLLAILISTGIVTSPFNRARESFVTFRLGHVGRF